MTSWDRRARQAREAIAQLKHPPEFRVPRPLLEPAQADWVASVLSETETADAETTGSDTVAPAEPRPSGGTGNAALVGTAVGIWRALRKLEQDTGALSAADLRQVRRQINASRQALADDGLEIQDHDGAAFDSGLSLEVLLFQEEPELSHETVLETVRPSVYLRGERVQMGQVIVGRPASAATAGSTSAQPGPAQPPSVPNPDEPRRAAEQGEHDHA